MSSFSLALLFEGCLTFKGKGGGLGFPPYARTVGRWGLGSIGATKFVVFSRKFGV